MAEYTFVPKDEYDRALIFALKKWISDEINNIYDNNIYAICLSACWENGEIIASVGYNTEKHVKENGGRWETDKWKQQRFSVVDNDAAVDGSVEIWRQFKGYAGGDEAALDNYFGCAVEAVKELAAQGIFIERFNSNIPVVIDCGENREKTALYTEAAAQKGVKGSAYYDYWNCEPKNKDE